MGCAPEIAIFLIVGSRQLAAYIALVAVISARRSKKSSKVLLFVSLYYILQLPLLISSFFRVT